MTAHRCMVIMPMVSGVPADSIVNTWYFDITGGVPATCASIETALKLVYDSYGNLRSQACKPQSTKTKWYDMTDPKPRAPVFEGSMVLTTTTDANAFPAELALCLSFQGAKESGVRQASRRGRVYLGPFGRNAHDDATGRPKDSFITATAAAAGSFLAASDAAADWSWVVYSEKLNGWTAVTDGWVDDAWDIQRRRGLNPAVRRTFT